MKAKTKKAKLRLSKVEWRHLAEGLGNQIEQMTPTSERTPPEILRDLQAYQKIIIKIGSMGEIAAESGVAAVEKAVRRKK